jgi:hypothetical protein
VRMTWYVLDNAAYPEIGAAYREVIGATTRP